jgi:uncharacterized protein YbbC (DUF1343 family)
MITQNDIIKCIQDEKNDFIKEINECSDREKDIQTALENDLVVALHTNDVESVRSIFNKCIDNCEKYGAEREQIMEKHITNTDIKIKNTFKR